MFILNAIKQYSKTDKTALINREQRLSFKQLDDLSEAFAAYLLETFGDDRTPVVIYGHKQTEFLPLMYGALKAGRAYVPVDITIPRARAFDIIKAVSPRVIIDLEGAGLAADGAVSLSQAGVNDIFHKYSGKDVLGENWVKDDDFCYILFTSGSTGKPKGVPISCKNLENLARDIIESCDFEGDIALNQISYSFDVSVISVYICMSLGKTLYTIDKDMVENLNVLYENLQKAGLCFWVSTPSFAEICVVSDKFSRTMLPKLEKMLFCGETLTHKLVETLWQRFPGLEIINTYGPTEATVLVTKVIITPEMQADGRPLPIGQALPHSPLRIDNAKDGLGELIIMGESVSQGYYKRPDLTEKVFFETVYNGKKMRAYKTGDAACFENGLYYFCGRMDFQIKLNGFRIELEDIENNFTKVQNVLKAVVVPVTVGEKVDHLVAFVILEKKSDLSGLKLTIEIKNQLKQHLPAYMIPKKIVVLDAFPINTNGKIDRKALSATLGDKR